MNIIKNKLMRNLRIFAVLWLTLIAASFHASFAVADKYDNTSLVGTYTSMSLGRGGDSPTAGMTILTAHGAGQFWGKTVVNVSQPANDPEDLEAKRQVLEIPIRGKYNIAEDGTGKLILKVPDELGEPQTAHFVITQDRARQHRVHRRYNKRIATELTMVFDKLLPGSNALQTTKLKRRTWREPLSNASLAGTYVSTGISRGGTDPGAVMAVISADGKGGFVSKSIINRPNLEEQQGEREVLILPAKGKYHINPDGMGTVEAFPLNDIGLPPQKAHFVVTEARPHRRLTVSKGEEIEKDLLVTQMWLVFDELTPRTNALQTVEFKRRGN